MKCGNKKCRHWIDDGGYNCRTIINNNLDYCKHYIPEAPSLKEKLEEVFSNFMTKDGIPIVKAWPLKELLNDLIDKVEK